MDRYRNEFKHLNTFKSNDISWFRAMVFYPRIWMTAQFLKLHFRFGFEYNPFQEGLEIKYACEAAEKNGSRLEFLGNELSHETRQAIIHETRYNILSILYKKLSQLDGLWAQELNSNKHKAANAGIRTFMEQCMDQANINWHVKNLEEYEPYLKRVLVDQKDIELFKKIDRTEGQRIVAVVNQWHLEGIEHQWCHAYGQLPRSVEFKEPICPIGDMQLREGLFNMLFNALQREIKSAHSKSAPATF